jgi:hypothetical protein
MDARRTAPELTPPDIVLLGPEWRERALLRAQLIEEGHDVIAIDAWPIPRLYRQPGMTPRMMIVDLHGLPDPRATLDELRLVIPPDRVLVVTALGTLTADEIRRLGFRTIARPATIGEIVAAAASLLPVTPAARYRHPENDRPD